MSTDTCVCAWAFKNHVGLAWKTFAYSLVTCWRFPFVAAMEISLLVPLCGFCLSVTRGHGGLSLDVLYDMHIIV